MEVKVCLIFQKRSPDHIYNFETCFNYQKLLSEESDKNRQMLTLALKTAQKVRFNVGLYAP